MIHEPLQPAYRLYIDESGDHTYRQVDQLDRRYLGITGVLIGSAHYRDEAQPGLENLKRRHFTYDPDAPPVLVRSHLVRRRGPFWRLRDPGRRAAWDNDLLDFIRRADIRVFTVVIDKYSHLSEYGSAAFNPYAYSLQVLLTRVRGLLHHQLGSAASDVMVESRGAREDSQLESAYRRFQDEGDEWLTSADVRAAFPNPLMSRRKDLNVAGLQIADLLANPLKMTCVEREGLPMHAPLSTFSKRIVEAAEPHMNQYGLYLLR